MKKDDRLIYCSLLKCDREDCIRHRKNEPWNTLVKEKGFKVDKNGYCEGYKNV